MAISCSQSAMNMLDEIVLWRYFYSIGRNYSRQELQGTRLEETGISTYCLCAAGSRLREVLA
jgi:hypothetical protein